jgi:hypothetical protein
MATSPFCLAGHLRPLAEHLSLAERLDMLLKLIKPRSPAPVARISPQLDLSAQAQKRFNQRLDAETKGARERLSRHLMKMVIEGETDEHRLTVHGLSYLRDLDREIDSR